MKEFNCDQAVKKLELFIDNVLALEDRAAITGHLERCPACRQRLKLLQEADELGRIDFYPDPGEEYWEKVSARVMENLPNQEPASVTIWETIRQWFESPVLVRNLSFGAAAVLIIILALNYFQVPDRSNEDLALKSPVEREETASHETEPLQAGGLPDSEEETFAPVSDQRTPPEQSGSSAPAAGKMKKTGTKTGSTRESAKKTDIPFVPKQLTVTPKKPTAVNNSPAVEDPFKTQKISAEPIIASAENTESTEIGEESVIDWKGSPSIRSPRLPKQGISALDRSPSGASLGFSNILGNKRTSSSRALPNRSKFRSPVSNKDKSLETAAPQISNNELIQNKIILLEVLQTGKDVKLLHIALIELDDIYQTMLDRNTTEHLLGEAKEFYRTYKEQLIDLLGLNEYESRMARF